MTKIITVIAQVLVVAIAVIIGLRVLCWTIFAVLPQDVADRIRTKTRVALRLPMGLEKPLSQEGLAANQDHSAVAWWINSVLGITGYGANSWTCSGPAGWKS